MVGVCFWIFNIILLANLCLAKPKVCPKVCNCLGTYVDCASRQFDNIPSNIPEWATHLNLQNNSIKKLSDVNLKHLSELTELILNKNNIGFIPKDALQYQSQLKILELNRNKVRTIDALTFKSLSHLSSLKLKRNEISEVSDGAFYGLKKINKLILDYNHLKVISKGWLYGLETLKELSINHNDIDQIDQDVWEFCQDLHILELSFNNLEYVNIDTFKGLGQLEKLSLNNNNISHIKEGSFVHLPNLKLLNLSNNKIWWIVEDANGMFRGLLNLVKFHLAGNQIKTINAKAFVGLKNVTYLNLNNNSIASVRENAFSEMPQLKDLIINTTSLLCDCNLRWFLDWINLKEMKVQAVVCAHPEGLRGQSLLNVTSNLTCDETQPRLIEEPDPAIMALKGGNVSLVCKARSSSSSVMQFMWKKDNLELVNQNILLISRTDPDGKSTETTSQLNLINVENSHAGKYQCVATNRFGTTYSQKATISVLVYPTFYKTPKNVTVRVGDTVKWECAANGEPPPEIGWRKDGGNDFPAARERRMRVMPMDDTFFILDVKITDMGVYGCTAHNAAGKIVANASLIVEERPSLIKKMEDKEFSTGEHVVLQCLARGIPKPTITWYKDGEPIIPTERHFFIHDNQMVIIVDSAQSDSGIYECRLKNSLGIAMDRSRIIVKPSAYDTSNMLGIIIISVVCCAVLTSIIWVVIIYKTRRRMPPPVVQTELQEMSDKSRTRVANRQLFPDNLSDHSSCKDSGTGDSAKRSNDDLVPDDFNITLNSDVSKELNHSHAPLLHHPHVADYNRIVADGQSSSMSRNSEDV